MNVSEFVKTGDDHDVAIMGLASALASEKAFIKWTEHCISRSTDANISSAEHMRLMLISALRPYLISEMDRLKETYDD